MIGPKCTVTEWESGGHYLRYDEHGSGPGVKIFDLNKYSEKNYKLKY